MNDVDFRLLFALRFSLGEKDYLSQRSILEKLSWEVVDCACEEGFYTAMMTFPGWSNPKDMFDFGLIHPIFQVNGCDCLCVQLQPSPISESFSDTQQLAELTERCKSKSHLFLDSNGRKLGYSQVSSNNDWTECLESFRGAHLIRILRRVLGSEKLAEAFVLLSSGGMPDTILEDNLESCLFNLWLNLALGEPCAFRYKH